MNEQKRYMCFILLTSLPTSLPSPRFPGTTLPYTWVYVQAEGAVDYSKMMPDAPTLPNGNSDLSAYVCCVARRCGGWVLVHF